MKKVCISLFCLFFLVPAYADTIEPLLNKVTLQLNAEQWVTTKSALLTVGVNASVSEVGLEKIQNEVLDKLNRLTNKGEWHIVSFDRTLDQSGLERVQISAQTRIPNSELTGLRDKAKAISKPGETFTIDNVQLIPSEDEIKEARAVLRDNIYQQAKAEIERINKLYPEQKYYLHDVNFLYDVSPVPNMAYAKVAGDRMAPRSPESIAVGDKVRLNATVQLASNPDGSLLGMTKNH